MSQETSARTVADVDAMICFLTVFELIAYCAFETIIALASSTGVDTPSLLISFSCMRFWIFITFYLLCTILMTLIVPQKTFYETPMRFWVMKDLIACNALAIHIWYRLIFTARYLILVALTLLAARAILQEHAKSYDLAARNVKHALCHHAQAVNQALTEHAKTVERAIDGHNAAATKALRYQTKQIEATGVNIATSMNQCQKQVQISSAQTSREFRRVALAHKEQHKLLKAPMDARVAKYERRKAKLGLLNSGMSVTQVVLGTAGTLVSTAGCTVM